MAASNLELVRALFHLQYSVSSLALRCKRAGVDVDTVNLSSNDQDFLIREAEELLGRAAPGAKAELADEAKRVLAELAKAGQQDDGGAEGD